MGFRFNKRLKIAKGISLNIGSKGISGLSIGPRGAKLNIGKKGVRASVSAPGTGLSYTTGHLGGSAKGRNTQEEYSEVYDPAIHGNRSLSPLLIFGILLAPFIFSFCLLAPGYTTRARVLGFGWLAFLILGGLIQG